MLDIHREYKRKEIITALAIGRDLDKLTILEEIIKRMDLLELDDLVLKGEHYYQTVGEAHNLEVRELLLVVLKIFDLSQEDRLCLCLLEVVGFGAYRCEVVDVVFEFGFRI